MEHYDAVIIGSGQGGTPLSKKLAEAGWKTALIEKKFVGGTCVNVGCTPTKTMIASAKAAYTIAQAHKWGVEVDDYRIHMPTILDRKNKVVEKFRNGSQKGLEKTENLTLIYGEASFVENRKIHITLNSGGSKVISGDKIFLDAGTRPTKLDIPGLEEAGYFTSDTILDFTEVPEHLVTIGGNYIGLEFGQMYRRFGSKVTVLERSERLLNREDEDIAEEVAKFLQEEAIEVITQAQATKVDTKGNEILITIKAPAQEITVACSHILVAAGRTPNTNNLNLAAVGVETDKKGYILVNEKLETTAENIFAIGDIKGGPRFTHISYNDYLILAHNLLEQKQETTTNRMVPYTMFTDPQVARVGISEMEALNKNLNVKIAKLPMEQVARAIETGDTRGLIKAVVDAETGHILGAAIVGQEGGEMMSLLQMAMVGKINYKTIKEMIFAHPLYAESLNNLFLALDKPA